MSAKLGSVGGDGAEAGDAFLKHEGLPATLFSLGEPIFLIPWSAASFVVSRKGEIGGALFEAGAF